MLSGLAVLPAQTVHVVGPGGFAQIRDALAVASTGDVVTVLPGTYAHFTVGAGVTIRAQVPGTVFVVYDPGYAPPGCATDLLCQLAEGPTRFAPPPGQEVHCIGLEFRATVVLGSWWRRHRVEVSSGAVTFDRCVLLADGIDALRVDGARVHLQACTLTGLGTGPAASALVANGAAVTAVRCTFTGSASLSLPGTAVRLRTADLQGSQLQIHGGVSPFGGLGAAALDLDAASSAWLGDSSLVGGGGACPVLVGGGSGGFARCVLTPSGGCPSLPTAPVVGADPVTPLQSGALFTVDWRAAPNQPIAVFAGYGLAWVPLPGWFDQPLTLDPGNAWLAALLVADGTGFASVGWNLPAGVFVDTPLFVLGAGLTPTTWALSPPVGGVIR